MLGVGTWNDIDGGPALEGLIIVEFPIKHLFIRIIGLGPANHPIDFLASVIFLLESVGCLTVSH